MRRATRPALAAALLAALPLFSAGAGDEQPPADKALLVVRLPAGATLTIDSTPTKQTGAERTFLSPPLTPGKTYAYELKATWEEGGRARSVTREATVYAGRRTVVDLTGAG